MLCNWGCISYVKSRAMALNLVEYKSPVQTSSLMHALRAFYFIFTNGDCTCFYEEKAKFFARAMRANHKTAGSLKIYLLFAQKHGLLLTQLIWSHFFQKYGKNAHIFFLVQPGPKWQLAITYSAPSCDRFGRHSE